MTNIVLCTAGCDPLHSGHLAYFKEAEKFIDRTKGDIFLVGLNSDEWLIRKKSKFFLTYLERCAIISELKCTDGIVSFDDSDDTATDAIIKTIQKYNPKTLIFANGGDRTLINTPEVHKLPEMYKDTVQFVFGVGGTQKINSSSTILENWKIDTTYRTWGYYDVLKDYKTTKIKELVVEPNKCLSNQRHQYRSELWYVRRGTGSVITMDGEYNPKPKTTLLTPGTYINIPRRSWHQLINSGNEPLSIIEIQYGDSCDESDIERK